MAITSNFKADLNTDFTQLSITDTSTANYDAEIITKRELIFDYPDGSTKRLDFPIVSGVGDAFILPLTEDIVVTVTLVLTPSFTQPASNYTKSINVLLANRLAANINNLRATKMLDDFDRCDKNEMEDSLYNLELLDGFYTIAKTLTASDLPGAGKALRNATRIYNNLRCDD